MTPRRRIFCNRTLNLRSIRAIGYDMDYTLIHYHVDVWEAHAYAHVKRRLVAEGWPIEELEFDPTLMIRGLIVDTELGNVIKANRFGFVKNAYHGTQPIPYESLREVYARQIVDLSDRRWAFMNTLFSLSEACLYAQLVELLDAGKLPPQIDYTQLYRLVRLAFDETHMEGALKTEIIADPDRFVDKDPEAALALLDQKHAGKKLLLITNSGWGYTSAMMTYAFDPYLPGDMTWRELFDLVIVSARKPSFFTQSNPAFEVVQDDGLLRPVLGALEEGHAYFGADAGQVQTCLRLHGEQILYVGDHIFSDVNVSKSIQRWRTALILRELEHEIEEVEAFRDTQEQLAEMMGEKESLEAEQCGVRLAEMRLEHGYGPEVKSTPAQLRLESVRIKAALLELDQRIRPLAAKASSLGKTDWGPLMRAGNDKSHLARQIERYADVYLARVGDFVHDTPFKYVRSVRGSLPHDV